MTCFPQANIQLLPSPLMAFGFIESNPDMPAPVLSTDNAGNVTWTYSGSAPAFWIILSRLMPTQSQSEPGDVIFLLPTAVETTISAAVAGNVNSYNVVSGTQVWIYGVDSNYSQITPASMIVTGVDNSAPVLSYDGSQFISWTYNNPAYIAYDSAILRWAIYQDGVLFDANPPNTLNYDITGYTGVFIVQGFQNAGGGNGEPHTVQSNAITV